MAEREQLDVDVLFVGAGPAGLSGALHLANLLRKEKQNPTGGGTGKLPAEPSIAVIEKAEQVGFHSLSGAVVDPRALKELFDPFPPADSPFTNPVIKDSFCFLTGKGKYRFPLLPPPLRNHGNYIASLGEVTRWLAGKAEQAGVDVFTGFAGVDLLRDGERVVGVRTGDKGIDKHGKRKSNFDPGIDIRAKVTVLAEGPRGSLTKGLVQSDHLDQGRNPQVYSIGIKELWELPADRIARGEVIHTFGYPLGGDVFGGGFLYTLTDRLLIVGLVVGLSYRNPRLDPHREFQRFKLHPFLRKLLDGGKMVEYGAKSLPEGGYYSIPKPTVPGLLIIGDSAGLLNAQRLKGIHLAMKSGMLAAESILEALRRDEYSESLAGFESNLRGSWAGRELRSVRNFHQAFSAGMWPGMIRTGIQMVLGGRDLFGDRLPMHEGYRRMRRLEPGSPIGPREPIQETNGRLTFDKVTDVFHSGTKHDEDQPCHLVVSDTQICRTRCTEEYGNPCQHFCPANVYEMITADQTKSRDLQINFANCVHCKTCDIMDPYQIINWVPPLGGDGPQHKKM